MAEWPSGLSQFKYEAHRIRIPATEKGIIETVYAFADDQTWFHHKQIVVKSNLI